MDIDPEHQDIETFVEYLMDDERSTFTADDLNQLAAATQTSNHKVRAELEDYGLRLAKRANEKAIRGFTTSSNDRYFGKGSEKMHGGSGWEVIAGFASTSGFTHGAEEKER